MSWFNCEKIILWGVAYNKLTMKKFGPCKIVKWHDSRNSYEVELIVELNILPAFSILDLIEYYEGGDGDEVAKV